MTLQTLRSIHFGQVEAAHKVDSLSRKFWEKWWENDWSKIHPESFQEGSRRSRTLKTSSKIILSDPGPSGKNWTNWQKLLILRGFGTHFSHFCHADACVAMRRASRVTLNDSYSIYLCSLRVIRRQSGASQTFQKLRHLGDFGGRKLSFLEIYEKV